MKSKAALLEKEVHHKNNTIDEQSQMLQALNDQQVQAQIDFYKINEELRQQKEAIIAKVTDAMVAITARLSFTSAGAWSGCDLRVHSLDFSQVISGASLRGLPHILDQRRRSL